MPESTSRRDPLKRPPIQLIPTGLLSFLQLKQGKTPSDLPDQLQSTLEMLDWYFATNDQTINSANIALSGVGFVTMMPVPVPAIFGDYQRFNWVGAFTDVLGAAETLKYCVAAAVDLNSFVKYIQLSDYSPPLVTGEQFMLSSREPFFLPPNSQLGVWVAQLTGVVNMQAMASRVVLGR